MKLKSVLIAAGLAFTGIAAVTAAPAGPAAPQDPAAAVSAQAPLDGLASMLSITPEQKPAFDAWVKAQTDAWNGMRSMHQKHWQHPAVTAQERLENRAASARECADLLDKVAQARAGLSKVLSADQRLILENYSSYHGGWGHRGMGHRGWGHGGHGCGMQGGWGMGHHAMGEGCPNMNPADCPMHGGAARGYHHGGQSRY